MNAYDEYCESIANIPAPPEVRTAAGNLLSDVLIEQPQYIEDLERILGAIQTRIKTNPKQAAELIECLLGATAAATDLAEAA